MATLTIQQLFTPVVLGTSSGVIFSMPTTPVTSTLKNARMRLTNTTGSAVSVTLYAAPAATASAAANCFMSARSIAANDSIEADIPTLAAGDTLRGLAGAGASITCHEMGGVIYS
jgi:hypothetical protein